MSFNQGDIVWIDWRYIDKINLQEKKPRPCLVISNKDSNDLDNDVLLCPITTNTRLNKFTVLLDNSDLSRSLPKKSELRANKIFTYKSSLVIGKHCEIINDLLLENILQKVFSAIKKL